MSKHKEAAKSFLKMAGMGRVQEAYDQYVAPSMIHFKGDRQSLLTAMQEASKATPNKAIEIKHVYEDGDTVITHSLVTRQEPEAPEIAVVHIFRFEQDRIVELWDLGQPISKDSQVFTTFTIASAGSAPACHPTGEPASMSSRPTAAWSPPPSE